MVGSEAVQDGIPQRALFDIALDARTAGFLRGEVTVETIGKEVLSSVMEHCYWRELGSLLHGCCVLDHHILVNLCAALCASVYADSVKTQIHLLLL